VRVSRSHQPVAIPLPLGFVAPCLPAKAPQPPTGEAWLPGVILLMNLASFCQNTWQRATIDCIIH
jgi:hypothetical protein